jgi:hypothetical protein
MSAKPNDPNERDAGARRMPSDLSSRLWARSLTDRRMVPPPAHRQKIRWQMILRADQVFRRIYSSRALNA